MDTSWCILHFLHFVGTRHALSVVLIHFVGTRHGVSSLATRVTMLLYHKSNEFSIQSTIFTDKM